MSERVSGREGTRARLSKGIRHTSKTEKRTYNRETAKEDRWGHRAVGGGLRRTGGCHGNCGMQHLGDSDLLWLYLLAGLRDANEGL